MKKIVLVVAPHPDDETLGCGGTLLKHKAQGDEIHWLIVTAMTDSSGYSAEKIKARAKDILQVSEAYGFSSTTELGYEAARLDQVNMSDFIGKLSSVIKNISPEVVYVPFRYDAHSDHKITFDGVISSCKAFRAPYVKRLLAYETISETDFNLKPGNTQFSPNVWVNIDNHIDHKLEILTLYDSELDEFPFPRSLQAVIAQSQLRGVQANANAAEAFMLLKEIF
ncbi:PIG-L deacetylase family protein [Thalassotalea piscium]|uniref:LmbE family N-acetylglucosaminyl deacetylase n=1 Tax=Thalassotalea piscium TaxID=1230533 RepID=A0A7X0TUZ0_9GAMM|nr:PIG-L deacetylase family protein [Thalassotalea piscium]MBB6544708.1 LmbE family N-acetylglucosaminyl deacetylase [Thalassotalea piscium]